MAFILTTPRTGASSSSAIDTTVGVINANASLTIDSVATANTSKWFIEITDNDNMKMSSLEVYAINRFSNISHNITNIIGDNISFITNVVINSGNINLNIINNESVNLNYKFVRIQL